MKYSFHGGRNMEQRGMCRECVNKSNKKNTINIVCLECKWQYEGQDAFDRKPNLFVSKEDDNRNYEM